MKDILDIVKSELNMEFDEDSLHYERFVTHVKFLLQRVYRKELLPNCLLYTLDVYKRQLLGC